MILGVHEVTAFILAGGRSSRMGTDKALLPFSSGNLLEKALQLTRGVASRSVIVGDCGRYASYGEVIPDVYSGCGPLGGIHAALCATTTEFNLVLAVDMPQVTPALLRWLLERARESNELAVVPQAMGRLQPLCAVYRQSLRSRVEQSLRNREYKVARLLSTFPTCRIREDGLKAAGFAPEMFSNLNTPYDYDLAAQKLSLGLEQEP